MGSSYKKLGLISLKRFKLRKFMKCLQIVTFLVNLLVYFVLNIRSVTISRRKNMDDKFYFYRCSVHSEIYIVHSPTNVIFIKLGKV